MGNNDALIAAARERDALLAPIKEGTYTPEIMQWAEGEHLGAEIARLREALEAAELGLNVGRAWSEEYLEDCREHEMLMPAEVAGVEQGLATIDDALARVKAALTSPAPGRP